MVHNGVYIILHILDPTHQGQPRREATIHSLIGLTYGKDSAARTGELQFNSTIYTLITSLTYLKLLGTVVKLTPVY